MKLEEGQCYVDRDGTVHGPLERRTKGDGFDHIYPFINPDHTESWHSDGSWSWCECNLDLVAPHDPQPKPQSLGDIMQGVHLAQVKPKPRLGDHYAGLSAGEWQFIRDNIRDDALWSIAKRAFQGDDTVRDSVAWSWHHWIDASDAFAFGAIKYGVGCWREVSSDDHMQGAGRHFKAWLDDPQSKDDESGLLHKAHFLSRAIMCLEMRRVGK